jgi:hypothetical protein
MTLYECGDVVHLAQTSRVVGGRPGFNYLVAGIENGEYLMLGLFRDADIEPLAIGTRAVDSSQWFSLAGRLEPQDLNQDYFLLAMKRCLPERLPSLRNFYSELEIRTLH